MCAYVNARDDDVAWVFLALLYWVLGSVGAFYLWYKLGYRALETGSNFLMFIFLGFFAICTLFWAAAGIGVPESALAGFICMVKLVSDHPHQLMAHIAVMMAHVAVMQFDGDHSGQGLCCLVAFILFCLLGLLMAVTWIKMFAIYKGVRGAVIHPNHS